ncbi:MAG: hypothetical protein Kow0026_27200 [Oricola sp.]
MTSIALHGAQDQPRHRIFHAAGRAAARAGARAAREIAAWHKRRRDRAAFLQLLDKPDWVYKDMGIHRGDVAWAARLPLHVNAALELEKLRASNMMGR